MVVIIEKAMLKTMSKVSHDVGSKVAYLMATGNLLSNTGLDLQQTSGFTIVAERLNYYRYLAHFRCIHRGAYFAELKTTTVRKLLPEAWGFLCPVHTPDGAPCGLLNHLAHTCEVITDVTKVDKVEEIMLDSGVVPAGMSHGLKGYVTVQLDGKVIGSCSIGTAAQLAKQLRSAKLKGDILKTLEIGFVPTSRGGQYPGLYIFSQPARMVRPVRELSTGQIDWVGPFEQVYLEIACLEEDLKPGLTTHQEITPTNVLSVIANLTPFSDFNQSPRNMYQCQVTTLFGLIQS